MFLPKEKIPNDSTLVLAAVSVGNVGQFCQELLISNNAIEYCGPAASEVSDCIAPVVGYDALCSSGNKRLFTQLECFKSESLKMVVILQRADCLRKKRKSYLDELCSWIKEVQFKRVVLLSSSFLSAEGGVSFEDSSKCRFLCTTEGKTRFSDKCKSPNFKEITFIPDDSNGKAKPSITGGGIARSLYDACENQKIPLVVLVNYIQGESRECGIDGAKNLYSYLAQWLDLPQDKIKIPKYWDAIIDE